MLKSRGFAPRWASPPGDTIKDALDERGVDPVTFARSIKMSHDRLELLLEGIEPISIEVARSLTSSLGGSVAFWMARDCQYRDDIAWIEAERWSHTLPKKDMKARGWLPPTLDWQEEVGACLDYFGVPDLASWDERYGTMLNIAKFRTPKGLPLAAGSVATWIRQAEIQSRDFPIARWNPESFESSLAEIKRLSRIPDPKVSVPRLVQIAANSGVAVAVVPAPEGCPASGVARASSAGSPLIVLSGRYRSDDHLWFSFFHEAGHLLLHERDCLYVDDLAATSRPTTDAEVEADAFAQRALLPDDSLDLLSHGALTNRAILSVASRVGVAPGVVVGQLQHAGLAPYDHFNYLKRRYRWDGASLGIA